MNVRADLLESDLFELTDLLEGYREQQETEKQAQQPKKQVQVINKSRCLELLKSPDLLQKLNQLIAKAGVVGEEKNRLFLFGVATSYKMPNPLNALIQGSSGSGKTHLMLKVSSLIPEEDRISLTRVTDSSFYNYRENELYHKLTPMAQAYCLCQNIGSASR